jgi:hypothetical protein
MVLHLLTLLLILPVVSSLHNITIDDSSSAIVYSPPASWTKSAPSTLDSGGTHTLTEDPAAIATFTFTGVAIYYMAPLWPYLVNTAVSLDSGSTVLLDLTDHSQQANGGPETVASHVIWGVTGLSNIQHSLVMSVGSGQPYGIVDALIVTVLDQSETTSITTVTSILPSPVTTIVYSNATTSAGTAGANGNLNKRVSSHVRPIALGTVLGVFGLAIIALALWFCARPRKRPTSEAWTVPSYPYPASPHSTAISLPSTAAIITPYPIDHHPSNLSRESRYYRPMPPAPGATYPAGEQPWQGTTAQIAQRYNRAPNRFSSPPNTLASYQPNTLSTITETSSGLGYSPNLPGNQLQMPPTAATSSNPALPPHPPAYTS